jgi:hypothetical protein
VGRSLWRILPAERRDTYELSIGRFRCFLAVQIKHKENKGDVISLLNISPAPAVQSFLRSLIHIPSLRGRAERLRTVSSPSEGFPGVFENYVPSILNSWSESGSEKLEILNYYLRMLGLARSLRPVRQTEASIEIQIDRYPVLSKADEEDFVSLIDVGAGVSQILPVLVALLVSNSGGTVYVEEPEVHLHPRAQVAIARVIADAIKRGVSVILETHSLLLLRALQTLLPEKKLNPGQMILHWFTRGSENGETQVTSVEPDEDGAFGDWPEDFTEVILETESAYLDAS